MWCLFLRLLSLSRFSAVPGEGVLWMSGSSCVWHALCCLSVNISWQEVLVFNKAGGWLTAYFIFSLHCHIIPVLKCTSMCFRSWSVKSLSKKAADSIITTTSTCWRPRRLKEVHVPEENLLDTSNTKMDSNLDSRALNVAVLLSIYSVCLHALKYIHYKKDDK